MASTISPNMNLVIPTVGTQPGPQYASNVNSSLTLIDAHDHSSGNGVQITPSGLNISGDLTMNSNNLLAIRSLVLDAQLSPLAGTELNRLYDVGGNLYFNDGAGNQIPITNAGAVAGTPGSISNLVAPASASYISVSGTFVFQSDANKAASIDGANYVMRNTFVNSFALTLSPPVIPANYSIILPLLPASQKIMTLDASGNMTAPYVVDGSTIVVDTNVIKVPTNGIGTIQIQDNAILADKILDLNVTEAKIGTAAITNTKIADGAISSAKIADQNVLALQIADLNVTTAKIATQAVTTVKIADLNVTNGKIADLAVDSLKLSANAVTTPKILDLQLTKPKFAARAIGTTGPVGGIGIGNTITGASTTSSTFVTTGMTVAIVSTGNSPIAIGLLSTGAGAVNVDSTLNAFLNIAAGGPGGVAFTAYYGAEFQLIRTTDSTAVAFFDVRSDGLIWQFSTQTYTTVVSETPPGVLAINPSNLGAGTYTYELFYKAYTGGGALPSGAVANAGVNQVKMYAYEL